MFACNIYIKASEAQIDEYSACTGRLSRTTDDLGSASELYRVIGLSPSVNTIIYLGLQPQHRLHTDKNTQQDLLNLHGCSIEEWVGYRMCWQWRTACVNFSCTFWACWGYVGPYYHMFHGSNHKCSFHAQISGLECFNHWAQSIHSGGTDGENEVFLFASSCASWHAHKPAAWLEGSK